MKRHKARIYQSDDMYIGANIKLDIRNTYYCIKVMRLKCGDQIVIFNDINEWIASLLSISKREVLLQIKKPTGKKNVSNGVSLFISVVKEKSMKIALRQCVELGVDNIIPVLTEYNVAMFNAQRSAMHIIEACEQSGRLSIPKLLQATTFLELINSTIFNKHTVIWCYEHVKKTMTKVNSIIESSEQIGVLIGPEAGFSNTEASMLKQKKNVIEVGLGSNILRADTAATTALSCVLFLKKQWQEPKVLE
ncbi:Ribosomal RNA small subunit methyltransferase E [Candidatus Xenohaliotis californiensis]|uniref:Ribosomal RNA small subunit methyltransferase E n=1 Tax=Candidatus Xenohaliotis californiensis TaxID=84677 RepID=A0ABP0EU49_9RICK|nr:Ribosomal RNA small subunit methyltransferase E [Candidatus Xenohaliotis californiensis]